MTMIVRSTLILAGILMLVCGAHAADRAAEPATLMTLRGAQVLKEDFNEPPVKQWRLSEPIWETVEGVLQATHRPPFPVNHGPVMELQIAQNNLIVQVEIKLESKTRAVLHLNKKNGHLCRALLTTEAFYIIRRDSGKDKGTRLDADETPVAPGVWHQLVMELHDAEMVASLDGSRVLFGQRDDLAVEKKALLLEASGGTVWFRNLRMWEALPNPAWEATRTKLQATRQTAPAP